jgi:syntaxin 16
MLPPPDARPNADNALVRRATGIDSQFASVETAISELQTLYAERLRPTFDSRQEIDARIGAVTSTIASAISKLRTEIVNGSSRGDASRKRLESAMQKGHASRLQRVVVQFREMQTDYLKRLQQAERRSDFGGPGGITITDEDGDFTVDTDLDAAFTGDQSAQVMETRVEVLQRNQQIEALIPLIRQLTEMMGDLGTLIVEQGTMLDRIDGLLEAAVDDMQSGNAALTKAEDDQKRGSKCFIIYMIGMIIIILILGTVILIRKGSKDDSGGSDPATPPE